MPTITRDLKYTVISTPQVITKSLKYELTKLTTTQNYRVILSIPDDGEEFELFPKAYSFVEELNKESTASFILGFEDVKVIMDQYGTDILSAFTATFREIWIERQNVDGTYVKIFWGGITSFEVTPLKDGQRNFTINATSWFGLLAMRIAGIPIRTFSSTDAGLIAWTLIDESQTSDSPYSDFGITQGVINTSVDRDRTYRFDNVKESIFRLSNGNLDNGFDFDIDNTKKFNVFYPAKGSDVFDVVFDDRTLASYMFSKPLILSLVNKVHVLGLGQNEEVIFETRTGTTDNRDDWFTQEKKLDEGDTESTTLLQDKGDKILALFQAPIVEFTAEHYDINITIFDYNVGDSVKVDLPELGLVLTTKRVIKRTFTMESEKSIGYLKSVLTDP